MNTSTKFPSVGIILINWNNYEDSHKCFTSLKQLDYPNYEVILVDNDSKDGSGKKLQSEFENFAHFIFSDKNLGFSGGNNLGIRYALNQGHDYVMELNNDTEVEPDFLSKLIASIDDKPEYGAAQPLIFFNTPRRSVIWNGGGKLIEPLGLSITKFANQKASESLLGSETDWITGCAFLIK
jgi:GT2 family glycosyltransferase